MSTASSDLPVRLVSAVVMLAIALMALWLGGWFWIAFVALVAGGTLYEWNGLVRKFGMSMIAEVIWLFCGVLYIGAAALGLLFVRDDALWWFVFVGFLLPIFAVDVGAYFAGRAIGGPKIAPAISPSKTWAGLFGGAVGAALVFVLVEYFVEDAELVSYDAIGDFGWSTIIGALVLGLIIAVIAQAGDFFESWMKRRAGVKDSGSLIPGHGGLFDRVDGLIAVFFIAAMTRYFFG